MRSIDRFFKCVAAKNGYHKLTINGVHGWAWDEGTRQVWAPGPALPIHDNVRLSREAMSALLRHGRDGTYVDIDSVTIGGVTYPMEMHAWRWDFPTVPATAVPVPVEAFGTHIGIQAGKDAFAYGHQCLHVEAGKANLMASDGKIAANYAWDTEAADVVFMLPFGAFAVVPEEGSVRAFYCPTVYESTGNGTVITDKAAVVLPDGAILMGSTPAAASFPAQGVMRVLLSQTPYDLPTDSATIRAAVTQSADARKGCKDSYSQNVVLGIGPTGVEVRYGLTLLAAFKTATPQWTETPMYLRVAYLKDALSYVGDGRWTLGPDKRCARIHAGPRSALVMNVNVAGVAFNIPNAAPELTAPAKKKKKAQRVESPLAITLPEEVLEAVDAQRGATSRNAYVAKLLREALQVA